LAIKNKKHRCLITEKANGIVKKNVDFKIKIKIAKA